MMNTRLPSLRRFISNFYLVLVLIFLYVPIVTMMILSFNTSKSRTQWGGFTTGWYRQMFSDASIISALYNTLMIALISALAACIIGTAAAIAINSMKPVSRTIVMGITNIPMLNADIVTGISMMLAFIAFGISLGFKTILIAHITFNIPYVILSVMPKLKQTSKSTYEAALDLGASPLYAFFKVVFPDILPGVLSGFLLAFTMSLDDFIITHFTRGAGINTLSTLIYSQVRRGIQPSMYALSTIIFLTVLVLLLIANYRPKAKTAMKESHAVRKQASPSGDDNDKSFFKKRHFTEQLHKWSMVAAAVFILLAAGLISIKNYAMTHNDELYVYNWGEYIDEEVVAMFEEETGIRVVYDMFETNEEMYPVIDAGAVCYDVVCPSDYMIQRMVENDMLAEINFDNIPNIDQINPRYMEMSRAFDPQNRYSVPYCWGTVGIIYNTKRLSELNVEPPTSWDDLWNPALSGEILMQDSVRDAFMVALKKLGYSMNTTSVDELQEAKDLLIAQKPLVQAYVIDQVRDKMIGGEAAVGVIYSGELLYIQEEAEALELDYALDYVIPKEGTNLWIDGWVIPANAQNKENAEKWINFLCRPDIALRNFEYITYPTPNQGAFELLDAETQENKAVFPDLDELENCEVFQYLGDEDDAVYNQLWKEVKSK